MAVGQCASCVATVGTCLSIMALWVVSNACAARPMRMAFHLAGATHTVPSRLSLTLVGCESEEASSS